MARWLCGRQFRSGARHVNSQRSARPSADDRAWSQAESRNLYSAASARGTYPTATVGALSASAAASHPAAPGYQPPPAVQRSPQQLPAGRAARTPVVPEPAAEAEPDVLTTQRAREQCWMASERTKFARNLDQKVKWVEKCVNDKMRTAGQ